ncbi:MAG TPA: DUF3467 domain-containing protein [Iamia sp.]
MTQQQVVPQFRTPEGQAAGTYANGVGVWSTPSDFTLDFFVSLPPEAGQHPDTGEDIVLAPQQVVARIKIPPPLVFQLMRNLSGALETHEQEHGPIPDFQSGVDPDPPGPPPE